MLRGETAALIRMMFELITAEDAGRAATSDTAGWKDD